MHPDNFKYSFKYTFFIANIYTAYDWAAYLKGHFDELLGLLINFTHNKGLIEVSMISLEVGSDIHIDDVSIFQRPSIRNSVTNHLQMTDQ